MPGANVYTDLSLRLPSGWELKVLQGINSFVGEVVGDGVRLVYDYGRFSWNLEPSDDPDNSYGEERSCFS